MIDRNLNIESVKRIYATAEVFDIPTGCLTVDREGIITPAQPMILFADKFLAEPPYDLVDKSDVVRQKWSELTRNVRNLLNPHTGFSPHEANIRMSAIDVFTSGVVLAHYLPGAKVVLPRSLGFKPDSTSIETLEQRGLIFQFNAWQPDTDGALKFLSPPRGREPLISRFSFVLKPPEGKVREAEIRFNLTNHNNGVY